MSGPAGAAALRYPAASRVCIVCPGGLGDAVWGLPVANALRAHAPGMRITWVAEPLGAALLTPHPAIDEVVTFERRRGWRGVRDLRSRMRGARFDLTLNLYHLFKSVPPTLLSRAPVRVGLDRARTRDGVWLSCNVHLPPRPRGHSQAQALEFIDFLGIPPAAPEWRLELTDAERRSQEAFFAPLRPGRVAAIVPASSNARKDWFADRYAEVADALASDFGFTVVLAGGPGERERAMAREIVERASTKPRVSMGDGVRRLVWTLGGCDLVVAPDTGPVHIARALDVPVVGLYGHTNPWRFGPYGKYEDLWVDRYSDPGEPPDPGRTESRRGRMEGIEVGDVLHGVQRAVDRYLP